jgi:hypothetical protein
MVRFFSRRQFFNLVPSRPPPCAEPHDDHFRPKGLAPKVRHFPGCPGPAVRRRSLFRQQETSPHLLDDFSVRPKTNDMPDHLIPALPHVIWPLGAQGDLLTAAIVKSNAAEAPVRDPGPGLLPSTPRLSALMIAMLV